MSIFLFENLLYTLGEIIALNEILQIIIFTSLFSGISAILIFFLLRQRSQLLQLQNKLEKNSQEEREKEKQEDFSEIKQRKEQVDKPRHDEFSENLEIIKDLQSKLDGLTVEMKIRGEMIVERDNKIVELERHIHDLNAQVSIFKDQIAPALEQTITKLRSRVVELQDTLTEQTQALQAQDDRITASQLILKRAGMGQILGLEELQIIINKKTQKINKQEDLIATLQAQVDQLPIICVRMTNEIKERDTAVHSLKVYNKVLNKKLLELKKQLNESSAESDDAIGDLSKKVIELQNELQEEENKVANLDRELLVLNGLIMEKEFKISNLEEKLQNIILKE